MATRLYDYAASGNCFEVRLLLGLLGRCYDRVPVDIFAGDTLTDAYAATNPRRETPLLQLDSGELLAQSSDILCTSLRARPSFRTTSSSRPRWSPWLSFEQERIMGGLGNPRFRLLTGRDTRSVEARLATGRGALSCSTPTSTARSYVAGSAVLDRRSRPFRSTQRRRRRGAGPARLAAGLAWLDRIRALPGFVDDFVTYPENARPRAACSIYET